MSRKATDLHGALHAFEPYHPLKGPEELGSWFRPRRNSPRERLKILLESSKLEAHQKLLFVGHRGSGKTTELNKLAQELAASYETIAVDILEATGRHTPTFQDVMLALIQRVTRHCLGHKLTRPAVLEPAKKWLADLSEWWSRRVVGVDLAPAASETELSAAISHQLLDLELSLKHSSKERERLEEFVTQRLTELIAHLSWIIERAETRLEGRRVLVLVEGLDKVDLAAARSIFRDHAPTIVSPRVHMIFSFPLALRHSDEFNSIRLSFTGAYFLPNIATHKKDGVPDQDGLDQLRALVEARLAEECIEKAALARVVEQCGGSLAQLVALVRQSALYALADNRSRIERLDADRAVGDLRGDLMAPLRESDYGVLKVRRRNHRLTSDESEQRLIFNGALVEYANGNPWCDAHPTLWELLDEAQEAQDGGQPAARRGKRP